MKTFTLDGIIGYDITAKDFSDFLNQCNGEDVTILINSPGGFVYDGIAIHNLIKNYKGNISVEIISLAASIASYIATASNKIVINPNSVFMLHNAWLLSIGDHNKLREDADHIEKISNMLLKAYTSRSGKSIDEIKKLMDEETFFFGEEIVQNHFADELIDYNQEPRTKNHEQRTNNHEQRTNKEESIALAKESIKNCLSVMKDVQEYSEDLSHAAALLSSYSNFDNKNIEELNDDDLKQIRNILSSYFNSLNEEIVTIKEKLEPLLNQNNFQNLINEQIFRNNLNQKISEGKLLPATANHILAVITYLNTTDQYESEILTNNLLELFDSLIDSLPKQNLLEDFATKPKHPEQYSDEVFPFGEVDPQSRQLHRQAMQLMKSENLSYMNAVCKLLNNK